MLNSVAAIALMAAIGPIAGHKFDANPQLPSWAAVSRAGNAMVWDATGKLTYAPNNLVLYSEDFSQSQWIKTRSFIQSVGAAPPSGVSAAFKLTESTDNNTHHFSSSAVTTASSSLIILSLYAKAAERSYVAVYEGITGKGKIFNLSNGTVGGNLVAAPLGAAIADVGNGWYRCSILVTAGATASLAAYPLIDATTFSYTGALESGVYVTGGQIENVTYETSPRVYNKTTSAAYYGSRWDYEPDNRLYFDASGAKTYKPNNQLTYSSDFNNAVWVKGSLVVNETNILAPDGTNTAAGLKVTSVANGPHYLYQNATPPQGTSAFCGSIYVKAGAVNRVAVGLYNGASVGVRKFFQLTGNGVAESDDNFNGGVTQGWTITNVGNDWYRISLTQTSVVVGSFFGFRIYPVTDDLNLSYAAADTTTSQIFVWGPQLEHVTYQTTARPYRATTSAAFWLDTTYAFNGLLAEETRTNSNRNSTMQGGGAGSPGTLPTNYLTSGVGALTQTLSFGTEYGMSYMDIRLNGTTSNTSVNFYFEGHTQIAAATGQSWSGSIYHRLSAGSLANISSINFVVTERNNAGSSLSSTQTALTPTSSLARTIATRVFNQATTAFTNSHISLAFSSGVAIDITLRIYAPQHEQGATASSPIATYGAAVTRAADVLSDGTYPNNPAQVFYMPVSTGVLSSQVIDWTNIGTLQNVWIREARIYPVGWFRPVPAHSVDYTNGKLGPSDIFSRAGQAMVWDSTGQLTYAPNNLILRSREFGGTSWTGLGGAAVTGTTTTPDGAVSVNVVTANGGNGFYQGGLPFVAGMKYILSAYVKGFTAGDIQLIASNSIFGGAGDAALRVNGQTGAFVSKAAGFSSYNIEAGGNGYWRISVVFTPSVSMNAAVAVYGVGVGQQYAATWLQLEAVTYQTAPRDYNFTTTAAYYGARFDYEPDNRIYFDSTGARTFKPNNQIRNSTMQGASAGTPGALPTNCVETLNGTTRQVVAVGEESGMSYVDLRISGTPNNTTVALTFEGNTQIPAVSGQSFIGSFYHKLIAGSYTGISASNLLVTERDAAGGFIVATTVAFTATSTMQRVSAVRALNNAATSYVNAQLNLSVTNGVAIDITLRLYGPQLERVTYESSARAFRATSGSAFWLDTSYTPMGLLAEEARTNSFRNNTMQGGVAGSPGTLPTNSSSSLLGSLTQTLAFGLEYGIPYMDLRLSGTTSSTSFNIYPEQNTQVAAVSGQTWTGSTYVRMTAGSLTNITAVKQLVVERNSAGTALIVGSTTYTPNAELRRFTHTRTLNQATTAAVHAGVSIEFSSGVAIDITLRIYAPQLEQGATPSSPILTYGAAVTRPADVWTLGALTQAIVAGGYGAVIVEAMRPFNMTTSSRIFDSAGLSLLSNGASDFYLSGNISNTAVTTNAAFVAGNLFRLGATWSPGRFSICANGGNVGTSPCVRATSGAVTYMGDNSTDIRSLNGYFRKVSWFGAPVNDNHLKLRTAIGGLWQ